MDEGETKIFTLKDSLILDDEGELTLYLPWFFNEATHRKPRTSCKTWKWPIEEEKKN
jgi:hypothetical protein